MPRIRRPDGIFNQHTNPGWPTPYPVHLSTAEIGGRVREIRKIKFEFCIASIGKGADRECTPCFEPQFCAAVRTDRHDRSVVRESIVKKEPDLAV